jgi:hypothetical protein
LTTRPPFPVAALAFTLSLPVMLVPVMVALGLLVPVYPVDRDAPAEPPRVIGADLAVFQRRRIARDRAAA